MEGQQAMFTAVDYAVFGGLLLISTVIGIFYAWRDRHEKDPDAYLVAKGQMSPIPVAISLCVSYVSGIMMVGIPTQIYYFGIIISGIVLIFMIGPWITGLYYIPLFFRMKVMSVYEILEIRFGKYSRLCASSSVIFMMVSYMGLVTYVPCLSLSAVSEASIPLSIVLTCVVCTFYTTMGGIKAVIWTDVLQAGVMVFGMIAVIVKTSMHLGGWDNVMAALARGDRMEFFEWSFDPRYRNSIWSIFFGGSIIWTMMAAVNQPMVQRYLSCRNVTQARVAVWTLVIPQDAFFILSILCGLTMYAYFETCDPRTAGAIEQPDQALPYMVVNLFHDAPGISGIFIAAVYSGTLSTVSSGINALSAVILSDYILKLRPDLSHLSLLISKLLGCVLGLVVLLMTFVVMFMGKMVIDVVFATFGSIGGPLLGVYTLAIFFPWANEKGAVVGQIVGMAFSFWVTIGQAMYPPPAKFMKIKPISTSGCPVPNATESPFLLENSTFIGEEFSSGEENMITQGAPDVDSSDRPPIADTLYAISYNYIGLVGFLTCIILGMLVSLCTGLENPRYANTDIFTPFVDNRFLPKRVRKFFRFGVPERQKLRQDESDEGSNKDEMKSAEDVIKIDEDKKAIPEEETHLNSHVQPNGVKHAD